LPVKGNTFIVNIFTFCLQLAVGSWQSEGRGRRAEGGGRRAEDGGQRTEEGEGFNDDGGGWIFFTIFV
jgi:hypothetical protein